MRKINIARAMKEKKRIISRMSEFTEQLVRGNIYYKDVVPDTDLRAKLEVFKQLQENLIELKAKLAEANANAGIVGKIYRMEELKSELSMWNRTSTDVNPERRIDIDTKVLVIREKSAFFSFTEVDPFRKALREEIENLQDEIDDLNAKTFIEVSF